MIFFETYIGIVWIKAAWNNTQLRDYWFSTSSYGTHFQWVGLSVLIAAIGLVVNAYWSDHLARVEHDRDIKKKNNEKIQTAIIDFVANIYSYTNKFVDVVMSERLEGTTTKTREAEFIRMKTSLFQTKNTYFLRVKILLNEDDVMFRKISSINDSLDAMIREIADRQKDADAVLDIFSEAKTEVQNFVDDIGKDIKNIE
ncbi:hypothetical protein H9L19_06770 [Weissella diestrammenae]|uniref:Uncharacterized protein n=1 Tax=Weissella diestrammenae TaxID=1162633 RepID=A0A7G9T4P9_9LACO|nr:hypothetical protein [Weissella diestrammenae]MCM0582781.1 hypothetical protein [Weissella diestrammenae]QNN75074.1 hypothetical protein H9L19_06770 [Weissella diestrammenae]